MHYITSHISFRTLYRYAGYRFYYDKGKPYSPWPLKKDLEPRARSGVKFYKSIMPFLRMPAEEQEKYRVNKYKQGSI